MLSLKQRIARFAVWLATQCGVVLVARPDAQYIESAHQFVRHVEHLSEPWEWKHRQAIRAMMNRFPSARIRDLNLAIEIAVQECFAGR